MTKQTESFETHVVQPSRASRFRRFSSFLFLLFALALGGLGYWWFTQPEKTIELRIGTGPLGSDTRVLMREVNEVAARHGKPLKLIFVETLDPSEGVSLLNKGHIDLALIRSNTPVIRDTRMVANIFPEFYQLLIAAETPVYRVTDLTEMKLIIPPFGTDGFRAFWTLVDHYNLPLRSLRWEARPFDEAMALFLKGDVDGLFTLRSLRDPAMLRFVEDASLKRKKMRFIPINQARAMALKRPFLGEGLIPQGSYNGEDPLPAVNLNTVSLERILVTKASVDPDAIRALTEILFENRLDLTIRQPLSQAIRIPNAENGLSIPLHEGAEQFYNRDQPSFVQENAEPLALGVTLITIMISGLFALRARFQAKQKNVADVYNYHLLDMIKRAQLADDFEALTAIKLELSGVLEKIVIALDADEITDEGFQSFALICDQVQTSLTNRREELTRISHS